MTLFTHQCVIGEMLRQTLEDQGLDPDIVFGDEVDEPFVADGFGGTVAFANQLARFDGDGFETFNSFHGDDYSII